MSSFTPLDTLELYQFGDFVFPSENQESARSLGVKNFLENLDYGNGQIRINKFNKDFTEDTFYDIQFLNTEYSRNQLDKVFYSKPKKIFFVEKYQNTNGYTDYRVYFAYASVYKTSEINLGCDDTPFNYSVQLRQIGRRYLIEDNRLQFVLFDDLSKMNEQWEIDNGTAWESNQNINWEDQYYGLAKNFNQLSYLDKAKYFNCCDKKGFFDYKDLYFKQEVNRIDTTAKNWIELNLTASEGVVIQYQANTKQAINQLNLNSTDSNTTVIFEIEKDGVLPALGNGEFIEIINNQTQSGFRITCKNAYAPSLLSIYTHKSIHLYDSSNNQAINFLNPVNSQNYLKWKIETIGNSSKFFELPNFYDLYSNLPTQNNELLLIKRNFTGNLKVKITNLPTFY